MNFTHQPSQKNKIFIAVIFFTGCMLIAATASAQEKQYLLLQMVFPQIL
jgi:hypothetical protein